MKYNFTLHDMEQSYGMEMAMGRQACGLVKVYYHRGNAGMRIPWNVFATVYFSYQYFVMHCIPFLLEPVL